MRKRFSDIKDTRLFTADDMSLNPVGRIDDLLVEDVGWDIRYLVVTTDAPLARRVLISPAAIQSFDFDSRSMGTQLTAQQIVESPPVDSDQPISREYEQALVDYYGWPIYWFGRAFVKPQTLDTIAADEATESVDETTSANLRSANEICGYQIESNQGPAGRVEDLVVHVDSWRIDHAKAHPNSWLPMESSMFSTRWISRIDWGNRTVHVDLRKPLLQPTQRRSDLPPITGEPLSAQPFRTS